ncbi:hypothetical protein K438DRAFT_1752994 [Mycena galopus ATCC 62051]|nr:hypothetical protein K438DRAFT_1752994 [Mycena galopus ATCC 62051]
MPVDRTPPTEPGFAPKFVAASTLVKNADPPSYLGFLSTEIPSKQTVRTSQGPIPVSSLHRVVNDRRAFRAYMAGPNRNENSPPPRASSLEIPAYALPPSSTPEDMTRHRLCMYEEEHERKELNERVSRAKTAKEAAPGDSAKDFEFCTLLGDYNEHYGHFVPDADIILHVLKKRQEMCRIDLLWDTAMHLRACPFDNPAPIAAYVEAARKFHTEFSHPYRRDDGRAAELTHKCRLHEVYTQFLATCRGDAEADRLIGQKFTYVYFVNPFTSVDPRRRVLDTKLRQSVAHFFTVSSHDMGPTLELSDITFRLRNIYWAEPRSARCRRKYFGYQLWADEIAGLQKTAELDLLKDDGMRFPISTVEFSQLLRDLKN